MIVGEERKTMRNWRIRHEVEDQIVLLRGTTVRGDPRTHVETVDQNEIPGPKGKVEDTTGNQGPIGNLRGSHVQIEMLDASRGSLDQIVNMRDMKTEIHREAKDDA